MTAWETIVQAPKRLGEAAVQARPRLRGIASPPRRMGPVAFAVTLVSVVVAGMVGLLALTTALQSQAFEVRAAQRTANELGYRVSDLSSRVNQASAPAELGRRATLLGMVPNPYGVFIDVTTGTVVGDPVPVRGDEMPSLQVHTVVPLPDEQPAAAPEAGESNPDGTAVDSAAEASVEAAVTEETAAEEVLPEEAAAQALPEEGAGPDQTGATADEGAAP